MLAAVPAWPCPDSMTSGYRVPWARNFTGPSTSAAASLNTSIKRWPMRRRFSWGSVMPSRSLRKASDASTTRRSTSKWSRKVVSTRSRSFFRSSPLSTKMHVNWFPMALCSSAATTEESTPPDKPQITRAPCTFARTSAAAVSTKSLMRQVPSHPQISYRKFRNISTPCGVWVTSGWNWTPCKFRTGCRTAAKGHVGVAATVSKPSGNSTI